MDVLKKKLHILKNKELLSFLLAAGGGLLVRLLPIPEEISPEAWNLFSIFVFTILGVIFKPLPMGAITLIALTTLVATKTLTLDEALSGFSHNVVWLVVIAFFIAKGFIKTGLGARIAYHIIKKLGHSTLGMGYGFLATDLLLAPAIPSLTARSGGIIYPVLTAVAKAFGSEPQQHPRKLGSFLIMTAFHGSVVTSAMFLTSMAGNPLAAEIVAGVGVELTWGTWALAAMVPGFVSLLLIPVVLYKLYPPEVKQTPDAKIYARQKLEELGKFSLDEALMSLVFVLLIILWVFGGFYKVSATTAALIGLSGLILCKVLSWEDIVKEKSAWDTLVWFSVLIMMASFLNSFGLTNWFTSSIVKDLSGVPWEMAYIVLSAIYFFSHYFFASNVAHIGSMFAPFFFLSVSLGAPAMLCALTFSFYSSLFGGLTHYGCGPAPIFFGSGYVKIGDWWKFGLVFGLINFILWMFLGGAWWKLLGLF